MHMFGKECHHFGALCCYIFDDESSMEISD